MIYMKQVPNLLTVFRILLVLPTVWFLYLSQYKDVFLLLVIAGVSDALDGYLARTFDWRSRLGAILDPVADKLLIAAVFIVLTIQGHVPVWVTGIILTRDLVIFSGAVAYRMLYHEIEIAPTLLSKINTATQIISVTFLVLSLLDYRVVTDAVMVLLDPYLFYLLVLMGLASGVDYVLVWSRKAFSKNRQLDI